MWADIDEIDGSNSPLHLAIYHGNEGRVCEILNSAENHLVSSLVCSQNIDGNTPLHIAAAYGNETIVRMLLNYKTTLDIKNESGNRALHIAVHHNRLNTVRMLLQFNVKLHFKNTYGNTALHEAAVNGSEDIVQVLLDYGASVHDRNKEGKYPAQLAGQIDFSRKVLMLFMHGSHLQFLQNCGTNVMHYVLKSYSLYRMSVPINYETLELFLASFVLYNVDIDLDKFVLARYVQATCESIIQKSRCELEVLKLSYIEHIHISYCDFLKKRIRDIAMLLISKDVKVISISKSHHKDFPTYTRMIEYKFRCCQKQKHLIQQGIKRMKYLFQNLPPLSDMIIANIMYFISNHDLINLIHVI